MTQISQPIQSEAPGQAIRIPLNSLEPDSIQILKFLETARARYSNVPFVRESAVRILSGLGDNDLLGQINRILEYVQRNVTYVRDPAGAEYVVSPVRLLNIIAHNGFAAGDCDDHVMLFNSLLGAIGFRTKFAGVKLNGSTRYNHVISLVDIRGKYVPIDPCAKATPQRKFTQFLTV